jgi:hypothetical protein
MTAEDYLIDSDESAVLAPNQSYAAQARRASGGARQAAGMAPYPLYGIGQTPPATAAEPFYRQNWFWFTGGGVAVGALWAYFGWWRPRQHRTKKKAEKNRHRFKAAKNAE